MGRTSSVYSLPASVREELKNRLLDPSSGTLDEHTAWIAEQGHQLSRSAIGRFSQTVQRSRDAELMLRCFDIASRYSTADTIADNGKALLKTVQSLLKSGDG